MPTYPTWRGLERGSVTLTPDTTGRRVRGARRSRARLVKERGRFPEIQELEQLVRERIAPGRPLGHSDSV
jgi:selenoprotein W-related protein